MHLHLQLGDPVAGEPIKAGEENRTRTVGLRRISASLNGVGTCTVCLSAAARSTTFEPALLTRAKSFSFRG